MFGFGANVQKLLFQETRLTVDMRNGHPWWMLKPIWSEKIKLWTASLELTSGHATWQFDRLHLFIYTHVQMIFILKMQGFWLPCLITTKMSNKDAACGDVTRTWSATNWYCGEASTILTNPGISPHSLGYKCGYPVTRWDDPPSTPIRMVSDSYAKRSRSWCAEIGTQRHIPGAAAVAAAAARRRPRCRENLPRMAFFSLQTFSKILGRKAGWWFQTCFIFHNYIDNPSHWLICFKLVQTTNQKGSRIILCPT